MCPHHTRPEWRDLIRVRECRCGWSSARRLRCGAPSSAPVLAYSEADAKRGACSHRMQCVRHLTRKRTTETRGTERTCPHIPTRHAINDVTNVVPYPRIKATHGLYLTFAVHLCFSCALVRSQRVDDELPVFIDLPCVPHTYVMERFPSSTLQSVSSLTYRSRRPQNEQVGLSCICAGPQQHLFIQHILEWSQTRPTHARPSSSSCSR